MKSHVYEVINFKQIWRSLSICRRDVFPTEKSALIYLSGAVLLIIIFKHVLITCQYTRFDVVMFCNTFGPSGPHCLLSCSLKLSRLFFFFGNLDFCLNFVCASPTNLFNWTKNILMEMNWKDKNEIGGQRMDGRKERGMRGMRKMWHSFLIGRINFSNISHPQENFSIHYKPKKARDVFFPTKILMSFYVISSALDISDIV